MTLLPGIFFLKLTINVLFQFERRSLEYVEWNIYGTIYLNDTSLNESQAPWLNVFSACNSFLESTLQWHLNIKKTLINIVWMKTPQWLNIKGQNLWSQASGLQCRQQKQYAFTNFTWFICPLINFHFIILEYYCPKIQYSMHFI